jgi:PKD domain/Bacterial Ig-like domain (group 1)
MFSVFMLPRFSRLSVIATALSISALIVSACEKVPLLAPAGSVITLTASATALPVNGTTQLLAQVVEPSGTPPHSGTQITFTTNLGSIQPASVETDINGQAVATFHAGTANGTATITAISGGVSASGANAIKIAVGTAAVGRVTLTASPTIVPPNGGTTQLTASVFDINGNPLTSAPVSFSTTAGTLDQFVATTDANGVATTRLTTANQATVTATVGATGSTTAPPSTGGGTSPGATSSATTATITINVAGAPTVVITPPNPAPTAGLPSTYTFAVTAAAANGSAVRDLTVNWGDGSIQDLGAVTGNAVVSHTYRAPGAYTITATVTDSSGFSQPTSTAVTVNPPSFGLAITAPSTPPSAGLPAAFTIATGTLPAGDAVRNVHIDWGDTSSQDLGAISGTATVTHVYTAAGTYTVTATLTDTAGNSTSVSTAVTVVATPNPTIIITPSVATATKTATFTIQVTPPTGVGVTDALLNFGDGNQQDLGGLNGTTTVTHVYSSSGTFTVTLTVTDTLGRKTTGSTTVIIP